MKIDKLPHFKNYSGWLITIFLCLVPVGFWLYLNPLSDELQGNFSSKSLAIGQIAGLVGLVMYSLNLIYATRLRAIENMFGGLNKVYKAHHILGGLALIFLCFHPLFLALSRASYSLRDGALLLLPNGLGPFEALFSETNSLHYGVSEQWAIFFGIIAFWGMVVLLFITFFVRLPYSVWLFIHRFLGVAFIFALVHVLMITSDTTASKGLKTYLLFLGALGICAFIYRSLLPNIFVRRYKYKVDSAVALSNTVTQISMKPIGQKLEFKPGQFIFIRFLSSGSGLKKEWHPFSISSPPDKSNLKISVKSLGDFTSKLRHINPGTVADIEGAYGRFSHSFSKNKNQIWIAGGIGITPFLSMLQSLPKDDYAVDLFYSVRSKSELVEKEKILEIAKIPASQLRLFLYIYDEKEALISAKYVEQKSKGIRGKDIFICGPPIMMKELKKQFKSLGVSSNRLHTEEFSID